MNQNTTQALFDEKVGSETLPGPTQDSILHRYKQVPIHGETIGKIASGMYYVHHDVSIDEVSSYLLNNDAIQVIGIVHGGTGEAMGLIPTKDLLNLLSKPFGRELYTKKAIDTVLIEEAEKYHHQRNVFSIAEEIGRDLGIGTTRYYLLVNDENRFAGIFSNMDMLKYLSDMTQRDLALAKQLQSLIVNREKVEENGRSLIIGASLMARGVGGDYYSIDQYAPGRWLLSLCDVSGKGMSASLFSFLINGMSSMYDFQDGVVDYIKKLNSYVIHAFEFERFLTALFVDYDENTGATSIYDMGHSYCYLYRENKLIRIGSKESTIPIGVAPDIKPQARTLKLKKDDILMLFTDGIEEQKNVRGQEFGITGIISCIKRNRDKSLKEIKDAIFSDLREFRQKQTQMDDMTLIFLHHKG